MGWTRLGVPTEWAHFLIQLDLDGTTTVRLPISQHAHDRHGIDGLRQLQALGAADILLPAERGVPQGDVASPFGWNAVYDILLRALNLHVPPSMIRQQQPSHMRMTSCPSVATYPAFS